MRHAAAIVAHLTTTFSLEDFCQRPFLSTTMIRALPTHHAVGSNNGTFGSLFQRLALRHLEPPHEFVRMPFDLYCPSVTADVAKRSCEQCGMYFPSQVAKRSHARIHKRALNAMAVKEADVEEFEAESEAEVVLVETAAAATDGSDDGLPVVRNLFDWMQSVFVDVDQ